MKFYDFKDILKTTIDVFENYIIGMPEKPKSTLGFKAYPSLRDHPLHSPEIWLQGKRMDDNIDGLWRIHDKLYNFDSFITKHPGGTDWLELTKGTDITEAFEAHHISLLPEQLLCNYFVKETKVPRNSPFTFHETGLYKTLKARIREQVKDMPKYLSKRSKLITDILLLGFLMTALGSILAESYTLGIFSGMMLTATTIASHNFFHQRDNFRMYYFDLTMMSSRAWRVSHGLSHHIYTNTIYDIEISALEPFFQYLTMKKSVIVRYGSWMYTPIVYSVLYFVYFGRMIVQNITEKKFLRPESYLPFILLLLLTTLTGKNILVASKFFFWIELISSFFFGVIGLNAGHHHPDVFHDGDETHYNEGVDWGVHQIQAAMDRTETHKSHFWSLISFGDHILHHLFPAIDHGILINLYPTVEATLKEFGIEIRDERALEVIKGQFLQLTKIKSKK